MGISCLYDKNGNLVSKKSSNSDFNYTYDPLNRLITVNSDQLKIEFSYDAIGRRLSKTVNTDNESYHENYLYDKNQEIGAFDQEGVKQLRVNSVYPNTKIPRAVAIELEGKVFAPIYDVQENIRRLIDTESKNLEAKYDFSAFGERLDNNKEKFFNPWKFASKRIDPETNLIYFGKRYYDLDLARWISLDPAGFIDSLNLYNYLKNNPYKYVDPDGDFFFAIPLLFWAAEITLPALSTIVVPIVYGAIAGTVICGVHALSQAAINSGYDVSVDMYGQSEYIPAREISVYEKNKTEEKGKAPPYSGKDLGDDPAKSPGKDFEWKGNGDPKSGKGSWINDEKNHKLHPDLNHPEPKKPHWDYKGPEGEARVNIDGTWEWK